MSLKSRENLIYDLLAFLTDRLTYVIELKLFKYISNSS